jgi:chloramphenicol 3-O phosphotransferase
MTNGTIIILNGASSSGKTSIVKALQDILDEPYIDAGLDKFLWMLPGRYLERPLWDEVLGQADHAGSVGHRLVAGMHQSILALSMAGNNVIADHVLVEPLWLGQCISLFCSLPAYFIGVRCPLEVLEQREQLRRNRTWGQARAQYDLVHAHHIYDLEVDTAVYSPVECALQIRALLQAGDLPAAFNRLKKLEESGIFL